MDGLFKALGPKLTQELEKQATKALGGVVDSMLGGSNAGGEEGATREAPAPDKVALRSPCNGRKKAVFIGINYFGTQAELRGCINDVKNVLAFITEHYGFVQSADSMRILTDEPGAGTISPTKANILDALRWLAEGAAPGDSLFLHFSGHGGTRKDESGDEVDGFDETILPIDFQQRGEILDDELHSTLVARLPEGVRLTAVFDSCHSGSVLDLPWSYKVDGSLEIVQIDNRKAAIEAAIKAGMAYAQGRSKEAMNYAMEGAKALFMPGGAPNEAARRKAEKDKTVQCDVVMFSGCRDSQTSADATIDAKPTGAASYALLKCLQESPRQPYTELLKGMRTVLQGQYTQVPQLSTARPTELNSAFTM